MRSEINESAVVIEAHFVPSEREISNTGCAGVPLHQSHTMQNRVAHTSIGQCLSVKGREGECIALFLFEVLDQRWATRAVSFSAFHANFCSKLLD